MLVPLAIAQAVIAPIWVLAMEKALKNSEMQPLSRQKLSVLGLLLRLKAGVVTMIKEIGRLNEH
jgi:hypothetical protein